MGGQWGLGTGVARAAKWESRGGGGQMGDPLKAFSQYGEGL